MVRPENEIFMLIENCDVRFCSHIKYSPWKFEAIAVTGLNVYLVSEEAFTSVSAVLWCIIGVEGRAEKVATLTHRVRSNN